MSIPEQISGISLGSAYVRPGTEGVITNVSFIAGGWITVDSFGDLTAIDHSRTSTGQIAFVSQSQQFYIAKKIPADFETTFDDSVGWAKLTLSGSFSGSFSGDGSGLTGIASSLFFSGSTGNDVLNLKTDALTLTGSAQGIVVAVTNNRATFAISNTAVITGSFSGDGTGLTGVAAAPAGNDKTVQFRSGSLTGGAADFVFDHTTGRVGIGTVSPSAKLTVAGDVVVTGRITAEEFHTEFVSASIIFQSGSTKFGNSADDNHNFTGSVNITGSVRATSYSGSFSGSFQGDGSNLTGIASSLAISGSTGSDVINLKTEALTITGSARNISVAVTNNTATVSVPNDLSLTNVSMTGSFAGNFSGSVTAVITNAISASVANTSVSSSVSDKIKVTSTGNDLGYYPTFVAGTGYQDVLIDSGNNITYNPSTNTLTAVTFAGALTGNATTATSASHAGFATTASHAGFAVTASHAIGYVKDGGGLANEVMVWKDGETASGSQAVRFNTGGATLNIAGNVLATSFTGSFTGSFSGAVANAVTASFALNALSASYAATASSADNFRVRGTLIASGLTYPIADGLENQYIQTNGAGTLSFNDVHTLLEEVSSGEALTKGDPLYISGSLGAKPIVYRADAGVPAKMPVIYIALETVTSGSDTRGIVLGLIEGVNTTGYPTGTEIYVAVGGGWTSTRPTGSAIVQSLGYITKEGAGGKGIILNPGPFNLPNLQKDYVWKGNASGVPVAVVSSSLIVSQALNATSASFATFASTATSASHALFANTAGSATTATSASFATNANTATSASHALFANSAGTAATATSASHALFANSAGTATLATTATTALTASSADNFTVRNSATIVGDLVVGGRVTAEEFHTEFVSASIIFNSGSTIFGNSSDDIHRFTGSVLISHQLHAGLDNEVRPQVVGYNTATGELTYFNSSSILASAVPGGTNQQVQYNNNGVTAGAVGFVWTGTNVGIGSTAPGAKLDVNGEVFISPNTAGKNTFVLSTNASNDGRLLIKSDTTAKVDIQANGASYFIGGNVGIGTISPVAKLQIGNGTSNSPSSVAVLSADGGNAVLNALSLVNSTAAGNGNGTSINFHNANNYGPTGRITSVQDSGTNASLRFSVYNSIDDTLVEKITLLSSGNVGIGTTSPTKPLHVVGGVRFSSYGAGTNTGTATKTLAVDATGSLIELDVSSNGTGVANQVAFWKDTDTVSGSAALTWNGSTFYINGTLEATEKSFVIDHPTLPGKKLVYGVLEGPEHAVYCRGKISGEVIQLPEEWTGLVDQESITVQLTPIGRHQNLYVVDIKNNQVKIRNGDLLSSKISAHYFIQATRKDVRPLATVREA